MKESEGLGVQVCEWWNERAVGVSDVPCGVASATLTGACPREDSDKLTTRPNCRPTTSHCTRAISSTASPPVSEPHPCFPQPQLVPARGPSPPCPQQPSAPLPPRRTSPLCRSTRPRRPRPSSAASRCCTRGPRVRRAGCRGPRSGVCPCSRRTARLLRPGPRALSRIALRSWWSRS